VQRRTKTQYPWRALLAVLAYAALTGPAFAQNPDADLVRRLQRQMLEFDQEFRLMVPTDQPISERAFIDYGGSVRFGFLGVDNSFGSTRILRQTEGIFYLRAELDGAHRFFGRLRLTYNDFNSGDSFDGDGDELDQPIGDRYWYQFDLRGAKLAESGEYIDHNLNIKVGRQFLEWGSGLTLSDGLYAALIDGEIGDLGIQGLVGLTPSSGTVDWDGSRPGFDRDTDRWFYGLGLEWRGIPTLTPYVSYLVQRDENDRNFGVINGIPTWFDYDSEYLIAGARGSIGSNIRYRAEVVYETGETLSNSFNILGQPVTQTSDDVKAWAGLIGFNYLFLDEHDTRIDVEFAGASGDDDRITATDTFGGNRRNTDDNSFNSLGYVDTGLALAPELANLLSLRVGISAASKRSVLRPDWLRAGITGFLFAKADQDAPASFPTTRDTFIGGELNMFVDWRITSDVRATVRYGVFFPGDAIPAGQDDPRHFIYGGVTYEF
jgi:hypothetical protein